MLPWKATKEDCQKIITKYPNRIPTLIYPKSGNEPPIDKNKYLVPPDLIVSSLITVIRHRMNITKEKAIIFIIKKGAKIYMPHGDQLVGFLYDLYRCEDTGFLIMNYFIENSFG